EAAGLVSGDIITRVNGHDIYLSSDLPHRIGRLGAGDTAKLDVVRGGKKKKIEVEIGAMPDSDGNVLARNAEPEQSQSNRIGVLVAELTDRQRKDMGNGVIVKEVRRGPAANAGVVRGDLITMIGGEIIRGVDDFDRIIAALPEKRNVPMRIVRRGQASFIPLRID
ncbi:MAG: serine peptidase, partial [Thalassolituus sp.]